MKELIVFHQATIFYEDIWQEANVYVADGFIYYISNSDESKKINNNFYINGIFKEEATRSLIDEELLLFSLPKESWQFCRVIRIDAKNKHLFPGFTDVHVHFREPGASYKETILSGSLAAAHGGFTTVCAMPNLNPIPDSLEQLNVELDIIKRDARVHVLPYGSISVGQDGKVLAEMEKMAKYVVAFSDDGRGVQDDNFMSRAFELAKSLDKVIVAHAEINGIGEGGNVHDGIYAKLNNKKRNDPRSESLAVKRDLDLAKKTGASYHVCHVSSLDSVRYLREAKENKVDCTYETAPHYLLMNDSMLQDEGRFQMNPPIRSLLDQMALIEAIRNNEILCIATDHAPHSEVEKSGGLGDSLNGVVGLETSFPLLYTYLVGNKVISLEKLVDMMSFAAIKRFKLNEVKEPWENLGIPSKFAIGEVADLCLYDLEEIYQIKSDDFLSKGKASPFEGWKVQGRCLLTLVSGKKSYCDERLVTATMITDVRESY